MNLTKRSWILFVAALLCGFSILGFMGREIFRQAPPVPSRIQTESGETLFSKEQILTGQLVWQSTGGQQLGSVWGHGAYQAPDWSADWLHREATFLLDILSRQTFDSPYDALTTAEQGQVEKALVRQFRTNTYDARSGVVTVSSERAQAIAKTARHYEALFGGTGDLSELRAFYAMKEVTVRAPERLTKLSAFFFWTSWAASTQRPGLEVTYTNNWPHEPLVDNRPTGTNLVWSMVSILLLLLAIAAVVLHRALGQEKEPVMRPPTQDPLRAVSLTPSMRATGKFVAVVALLFCIQVLLGAVTAHYTVEGQAFFGFPLAKILPYSLSRTWHIQTGMFWIATAFLAAGLFIAPLIGGREPRFQRLGVNVLFCALLLVVFGSLGGEALAIHQKLDLNGSFWWGHQGYEYTELGRFWQIGLFTGLLLWLGLMLRGLWPALRERASQRTLVFMFTGATVAVGLMYGAAFFVTAKTHLSVMEYYRWWVVHLWVEGFFEVFATATLAVLFSRMGLVHPRHAGLAVVASSTLFLFAGIPGTLHHLYFSGTPTSVVAVGATFSALEVVPLTLIGFEAVQTSRLQGAAPFMRRYRWPIRFFVGVAFWNLVGAGLFGFLINPPIALYYMQGLNTTPVHAHTSLFGVYGLLSLGFCLIIARRLSADVEWNERALGFSFWAMNVGLGSMVALSLLPVGIIQTVASVDRGLWYARSAEFLSQPLLQQLRWLRIVGDTIFLAGVGAFAWFLLGLVTGHSYRIPRISKSLGTGSQFREDVALRHLALEATHPRRPR